MTIATDVEHCTLADIDGRVIPGDDAERTTAVVTKYLTAFAKPFKLGDGLGCLKCGRQLTGFSGSFTFHAVMAGEGKCCECGWPARAHHNLGSDVGRPFNFVLQYHPDFVRDKNAEDREENDA